MTVSQLIDHLTDAVNGDRVGPDSPVYLSVEEDGVTVYEVTGLTVETVDEEPVVCVRPYYLWKEISN